MAARRVVYTLTVGLCAVFLAGLGDRSAEAGGLMATGALTSQPIGHYELCKRRPDECAIRPRDEGPLEMTEGWRKTITSINLSVNEAVKPMSDRDIYGKEEVWTYPHLGIGDCEDYVLEKRKLLQSEGLSLSNLLITVVSKSDGEGHAVLTVRTDQGDFILDNLDDEVKLWSHTSYKYLKRQASNHTGRWVSLRNEDNLLVGSVRD